MQAWAEEAEGEAWWTSEESQCLYVKENKVSSTKNVFMLPPSSSY